MMEDTKAEKIHRTNGQKNVCYLLSKTWSMKQIFVMPDVPYCSEKVKKKEIKSEKSTY